MVGVVVGTDRENRNTIRSVIQLTEVRGVKLSDFFERDGVPYVTTGGRTYRIAQEVECFRAVSGNLVGTASWLSGTGAERLSAIKAYSDSFTVYVDPVGSQVRIIRAN